MVQNKNLKHRVIEDNFFRPRWYSVFINPYFISRFSLYREIKQFSSQLSTSIKILDVGCGNKPYRSLFASTDYLGIDVESSGHSNNEKTVDQYFDGTNIPYSDKYFDIVICTQVLEHATEPEKLTREISRVLKNNGEAFITVPFVWNEHETPYDFRRLTRFGLTKLLDEGGLTIKSLKPTTGVLGVIGQLFSAFIFESLNFRNSLIKIIICMTFIGPIQIFSLLADWLTGHRWITLDYVIIAQKND